MFTASHLLVMDSLSVPVLKPILVTTITNSGLRLAAAN